MENNILIRFCKRMEKLGIKVELVGNIPWIYIEKINGKKIEKEDYFLGNHGFTIAFYPIRNDQVMEFTDISKIFKLIRKYILKMNIDKLIDELTSKLVVNNHYRGRNRRRDYVLFFLTDDHDNIINIRIDHDEIIKQDFSKLEKYL